MNVRALPHVRHSAIGKSKDPKGTAYNHVNYILREQACSHVRGENMPLDRKGARPYFDERAYREGQPANGRVADTVIIAMPIELTTEQRHDVLERFMKNIGQGRIAWLAAFHETGDDAHNPHVHLIFRDEDVERGGKVLGTTTSAKDVREAQENGWKVPPRLTSGEFRKLWCEHLNNEFERLGIDTRFDHRTLKERGIDREPQIHVGPNANAVAEKGRAVDSKDLNRGDNTMLPYTLIDDGNRLEHNRRIIERNREREAEKLNGGEGNRIDERAPPRTREERDMRDLSERQRKQRHDMYKDQAQDRHALREAHHAQDLAHQRWARKLYKQARDTAWQNVKQQYDPKWKELRNAGGGKLHHDKAAEVLKLEQKGAYQQQSAKEIEKVRPHKGATWQALKEAQESERQALKAHQVKETTALTRQHAAERQAARQTWRAYHQAQHLSGRLQSRQGMANIQAAAIAAEKLNQNRAPTKMTDGSIQFQPTAQYMARAYEAIADDERQTHAAIRQALTAERQSNQVRAALPAEHRTEPGQLPAQRTANRTEFATQQQSRRQRRDRREGLVNAAASAGRDAAARARSAAEDPSLQARQAAQSGRNLTSDERANASPEVKGEADHADRKAQGERNAPSNGSQKQQRSKSDRSGGRSGR